MEGLGELWVPSGVGGDAAVQVTSEFLDVGETLLLVRWRWSLLVYGGVIDFQEGLWRIESSAFTVATGFSRRVSSTWHIVCCVRIRAGL